MTVAAVIVYSLVNCVYCDKAKSFLEEKNIPYKEIKFDKSEDDYRTRVDVLISKTGQRTFPQIYFGEEFIGGYSDMMTAYDTLRLHDICKNMGIELEVEF